jgi:hypothetical protein
MRKTDQEKKNAIGSPFDCKGGNEMTATESHYQLPQSLTALQELLAGTFPELVGFHQSTPGEVLGRLRTVTAGKQFRDSTPRISPSERNHIDSRN